MSDIERAWHPASGNPRLAHGLLTGMAELNALYPSRPQGAQEGTIGDATHRGEGWTASDHNPWVVDGDGHGVVRAWDIQVEGAPFDAQALADYLAARMRARSRVFGSAGYVIYNRRITAWQPFGYWVPYAGPDPHDRHIHVSLGTLPAEYDVTEPWGLAGAFGQSPNPLTPAKDGFDMASLVDLENLFRTYLPRINHDSVVAAARGGALYVQFPKATKNPSAVWRVDGGQLLWITAPDLDALTTRYGGPPFIVPLETTSPIYRLPVVAGTVDPRK